MSINEMGDLSKVSGLCLDIGTSFVRCYGRKLGKVYLDLSVLYALHMNLPLS